MLSQKLYGLQVMLLSLIEMFILIFVELLNLFGVDIFDLIRFITNVLLYIISKLSSPSSGHHITVG